MIQRLKDSLRIFLRFEQKLEGMMPHINPPTGSCPQSRSIEKELEKMKQHKLEKIFDDRTNRMKRRFYFHLNIHI
jgi:hypothetical protein